MPNASEIASRRVSFEMHERFAALSGDRNPMHMDPLAARRTQAGAPVVHGIHTLLWALECLVQSGIIVSPVVRIRLKFPKWLYVGDHATVVLPGGEHSDPGTIHVKAAGMCILAADVSYGAWSTMAPPPRLSPTPLAPRTTALDLPPERLVGCEGVGYTSAPEDASALFPRLAAQLSGATVAEIAACSYIVGMELPGLHSMFSRLDLQISGIVDAAMPAGLPYRLAAYDERFGKARIEVAGRGVRGILEVFLRNPPVEQASMRSLSEWVRPGEFSRIHALIIGGSRGLGELTAKLIAAGGGTPTISYAVGRADAERIADEIRGCGGAVDVLQYDVRQKPAPQLAGLKPTVTHLFYFATNSIFRPKEDLVSHPTLIDFVTYYLQGFHDLCLQLLDARGSHRPQGAKLKAYYPSSVAVEERPAGMTEYSMIKAAGEQMCRDINQFLPGIHVLTTRLPRLRTDQTASVIPAHELEPVTVLLPIIRQMNEPLVYA